MKDLIIKKVCKNTKVNVALIFYPALVTSYITMTSKASYRDIDVKGKLSLINSLEVFKYILEHTNSPQLANKLFTLFEECLYINNIEDYLEVRRRFSRAVDKIYNDILINVQNYINRINRVNRIKGQLNHNQLNICYSLTMLETYNGKTN